ncbi:hypothetical protein LPJ66_005312 [Kickxella alabastrina]|uniref:Uncharacterized protein n=1 Tax=Kickxella alabastrina TaxID=61397 RepID=A0ACC1IH74_9FUNG|nr:hypothetical protein LPJ66_005312 [Kickxella alabastrina]
MAEKLAMDSAKEAGWKIRWPHIRMMSQSPDLTTTTTPAAAAAAASSLSNPSPGLAPQPKHSAAKSTVGAWTQVLGFIAELAEVFETKHEERAGTAAAAATEEEEDDEEGEGVDAQDSMSEVSPQAHHAASSSPPGRTVQFMRAHPLLCLLLGWALLATTDWLVTSKAVPHLLTLLTQSAWHSPPPPSTALPFDAPRGSAWGGSSQAHFTRWLALRWESLRLGVDDMGWRVQCAVVYGLSGFVCGHALQWAVVACGSLVVLRRCLRVGVRPTVAYVTYFGVAHLALSRVVLPPAGGGEATGGCDALDLVATCAGAAPYWCAEDVCRVAAVASVAGGGSGRTGLPAQSPFADAVAAAAAQGRSLEDRRQQRTRRLHAWRQAATKGSPATDGIRVNLILALATAAAFVCAAQRVRIPGVSFVRAFALFLLLDYACRRTLATLWPSAGDRYLRGGRMAKWLAFHVLGVFVLMVAREAAMRVLAMRVWYRTVVHERRRDGVAVLGRRRRNVAGVRLVRNYAGASANQARSTQTQSNQAASAVAAAYAHRVCFLCLSGFCEKCLLSMEIWPTTAAAVPTADLHSLAEASGSGPGSGPGSRRGRSRSKQNAQHVDPLLVEPANGLPSLRSSLLTIGLLGPSAVAAAAAPLPSMALGLVRAVDASICSVSGCDPSAAVLPLIFGRFTVPEYPQSLAAAAQLMVPSSGSSLATATADNVLEAVTEQLWRRAAFLAPDQPRARILNVDTPLAVARSEVDLERSFALSLTSMGVAGGCEAQVSVLLTPCLAHLLLAHEVTAHTAVVSVPPVLAPCTASSSSLRPPQQQNQQQNQQPGADAYYDFVRVQVPRHDIVLRVNGQRWPQHQISALHAPIIIRGLVPGNSYTVCLTILGMRSAELYIRPRDLFGGNNSGNTVLVALASWVRRGRG